MFPFDEVVMISAIPYLMLYRYETAVIGDMLKIVMMTSSNRNFFRVIGPLWITLTKASDTELWYFLWSASEQTVKQTMETTVIWDAMALIMASL